MFACRDTKIQDNNNCTYHLENIGSFIKVNHTKEQLVVIRLGEPERVGHDHILIVHMLADRTTSSRSHGSEHYNERIIPWRRLHVLFKLVKIQRYYRLLRCHISQLLQLFLKLEFNKKN